ncbi:MAG: hypothetical protein J0I42_18225 [Bosea sp.]|uniref:hypothetical protein n=1 Tax=Bosea sp. (in: a-proteobacteria) TaxID=1871050 RepID=UPI001AC3B8C5|nr:hypothetical protein [Bosea sp. (in: a-proteobacteria)]MBN9453880.1 hypothetical protein [Bosea sp. (in: a-proteobacteria)]
MMVMRSPLSQSFTQGGVTVQIEIHESADGWHLELLHTDGGLTVWLSVFPTDKAAMAALTKAVELHGLARLLAMGGEYLPTLH